jgi:NhaP-type Na+/H+ or K+/H+ antiporter
VLVPVLLIVIRPLLVLATVGRGHMDRGSRLFLGFFGVRGVAALFYAVIVVDAHILSHAEQRVIVWTTIICVVSSIVIHGLSAEPLTRRWLGQRGRA